QLFGGQLSAVALLADEIVGAHAARRVEDRMAIVEPGPGAQAFPPELEERLAEAVGKRREYRTHHLRADGRPRWTNRLPQETSPYLLQHAHNPVDWRAWSPDAFETARKLDRPIFLSVGYSTCHWCHVMEEES